MKIKLLIFFFLGISLNVLGQSNFNLLTEKSSKLKFKLIDNLIVVPVEVNGVKLSFLLDTGVSKPILFNIVNLADSLKINQVETIYLRGLGGGDPIEALKSSNNRVRIGNAMNLNQDMFVILDEAINFTPRLGVPIHGIIGYDIFKDFVVEVNYAKRFIRFHDPDYYVMDICNKCNLLNLSFYNNKPYMDMEVRINDNNIPVKLLIDSGGSDAIWLFSNAKIGLTMGERPFFKDFLGLSLSGSVYGKRTKIEGVKIGDFKLNNVNAAFPDSSAISYARRVEERNGSVSGEILKRFNMVYDYKNAKLLLKRNGMFNNAFKYNKSGITLQQNGVRIVREKNFGDLFPSNLGNNQSETANDKVQLYSSSYSLAIRPALMVAEVREDSPAERAGIKVGDVILSINGEDVAKQKLQEVLAYFYGKDYRRVSLVVDRGGLMMKFQFRLEPVLTKKSLQN